MPYGCYKNSFLHGGAVAQLEARLDGIEEVEGSNPFGSTKLSVSFVLNQRTTSLACGIAMAQRALTIGSPCHESPFSAPRGQSLVLSI